MLGKYLDIGCGIIGQLKTRLVQATDFDFTLDAGIHVQGRLRYHVGKSNESWTKSECTEYGQTFTRYNYNSSLQG